VDVWIRPLTSTELLALVRYGQRLFSELSEMHDAHLLADVVDLGEQWNALREALAEDPSHHVAPGISGGVRLREGLWVVLARDVQRAAPVTAKVPAELESISAAIVQLYEGAKQHEKAVLVHGVPDASLPIGMVSAPNHQTLSAEVTRLRRHLSLWDDQTLRVGLHRADAGLHSDDVAERWRAFIDLGEVLVDRKRGVHASVLEELKDLFIPLLTGHPGRHQTALLLGLIAEAMGHGGAYVDEITQKLHRNLRIVGGDAGGGDWPGVLEEAMASARICLALCMIRVEFAGEEVTEFLPHDAHVLLRHAAAGEQDAYRQAAELALRLAQTGR
jgi:hypothetical protein